MGVGLQRAADAAVLSHAPEMDRQEQGHRPIESLAIPHTAISFGAVSGASNHFRGIQFTTAQTGPRRPEFPGRRSPIYSPLSDWSEGARRS